MYESFFGLRCNPFRLAPDPRFFFPSSVHARGLAYLQFGLAQGEGFVVITGQPGLGKTMLVQSLLAQQQDGALRVVTLANTQLDEFAVLHHLASALGMRGADQRPKSEVLKAIELRLLADVRAGRRVVLIVDEAQHLPPRSLEELRMLSNFHFDNRPLIQIMLVGQQQLRELLCRPEMEQVAQRVIASCHLQALSVEDTRGYIDYRLKQAGWRGDPAIGAEALWGIAEVTGGVPRLINLFCDRLFLGVSLDERHAIELDDVRRISGELRNESAGSWCRPLPAAVPRPLGLAPLESVPAEHPPQAGAVDAARPDVAQTQAVMAEVDATALPDSRDAVVAEVTMQPSAIAAISEAMPDVPSDVVADPVAAVAVTAKEMVEAEPPAENDVIPPVRSVAEAVPVPVTGHVSPSSTVVSARSRWRWGAAGALVLAVSAAAIWQTGALDRFAVARSNPHPGVRIPTEDRTGVAVNTSAATPPITAEPVAVSNDALTVVPESTTALAASPAPGVAAAPKKTESPAIEPKTVAPAAVPAQQLADMVYRLVQAYDQGDSETLNDLLSESVHMNAMRGRAKVVNHYRNEFARSEMRQLVIDGLVWRREGNDFVGRAHFEKSVWQAGQDAPDVREGSVQISIKAADPLEIVGLNFNAR